MKKLLLLLLLLPFFVACSSNSDDPTETPPTETEEKIDITNDLCDGSRFIKREFKDYNSPLTGPYKAVMTQREYVFSKDGTGKLTTYVAESTPRGYVQSVSGLTWSATDKEPVSLNVSIDGGENFTLKDVEFTENRLESDDEDWSREMTIKEALSKEYIKSYSIDMEWSKGQASMPPYMICLNVSPARLNVNTTKGSVTYITSLYGYKTVEIAMSCYSENWGPLKYMDGYIYACVDVKNAYYPFSFCEIVRETEEKPFTEDGKMYFYLGKFDKETENFTMIEKNKEYELK